MPACGEILPLLGCQRLAAVPLPALHAVPGWAPRYGPWHCALQVWSAMNAAAAAVREEEASLGLYPHIVTVQGTRNWGRSLSYYVSNPITAGGGNNIVYETHPCECRVLGPGGFDQGFSMLA